MNGVRKASYVFTKSILLSEYSLNEIRIFETRIQFQNVVKYRKFKYFLRTIKEVFKVGKKYFKSHT